jgi:hypothetical protein
MGTPRSGGLLTTQLEFNSIRLIYIYTCCQTHLVCAFWSTMLLRRPRMFQCLALPFHSHSGGRERSHGGCGTKQQSRVFAGNLESNLNGLRFTTCIYIYIIGNHSWKNLSNYRELPQRWRRPRLSQGLARATQDVQFATCNTRPWWTGKIDSTELEHKTG